MPEPARQRPLIATLQSDRLLPFFSGVAIVLVVLNFAGMFLIRSFGFGKAGGIEFTILALTGAFALAGVAVGVARGMRGGAHAVRRR